MAKKIDIEKSIAKFKKLKPLLPKVLGNMALNHFLQSFRDEGFTDNALSPWEKRKRKNAADIRTGRSRALLVDSGALRKSLRVKSATFQKVRIGSYGIIYASIHNRGGTTHPTVTDKMRGFMFAQFKRTGDPIFLSIALTKKAKLDVKIPKRQFIGESKQLRRRISKRIQQEIKEVFNI